MLVVYPCDEEIKKLRNDQSRSVCLQIFQIPCTFLITTVQTATNNDRVISIALAEKNNKK